MEKKRIVKPDGSYTETSTEQQDSTELSSNKDGAYSWKIKCYDDDPAIRIKKVQQARKDILAEINKGD